MGARLLLVPALLLAVTFPAAAQSPTPSDGPAVYVPRQVPTRAPGDAGGQSTDVGMPVPAATLTVLLGLLLVLGIPVGLAMRGRLGRPLSRREGVRLVSAVAAAVLGLILLAHAYDGYTELCRHRLEGDRVLSRCTVEHPNAPWVLPAVLASIGGAAGIVVALARGARRVHEPVPVSVAAVDLPLEAWPSEGATPPSYEPASVAERFVARLVDMVVLSLLPAVFMVFFFAFRSIPSGMSEVAVLLAFGLLFAYDPAMTTLWGQTLGKMAMRIKVVHVSEKRPPRLGAALARWGALMLPVMAIDVVLPQPQPWWAQVIGMAVLLAPLLWVLGSSERRGYHDLLARTRVVKRREGARA